MVADGGLGLHRLLRSSSSSLPVGLGPFVDITGFAFEFDGPLARPHHFLHNLIKDLALLCQDVQGLHGLLVKIVNLGVRLGVLLVWGA